MVTKQNNQINAMINKPLSFENWKEEQEEKRLIFIIIGSLVSIISYLISTCMHFLMFIDKIGAEDILTCFIEMGIILVVILFFYYVSLYIFFDTRIERYNEYINKYDEKREEETRIKNILNKYGLKEE